MNNDKSIKVENIKLFASDLASAYKKALLACKDLTWLETKAYYALLDDLIFSKLLCNDIVIIKGQPVDVNKDLSFIITDFTYIFNIKGTCYVVINTKGAYKSYEKMLHCYSSSQCVHLKKQDIEILVKNIENKINERFHLETFDKDDCTFIYKSKTLYLIFKLHEENGVKKQYIRLLEIN